MLSIENPNLIKQPKQCCIYCGKSYKLRRNLDKHVVLCEIIDKTKRNKKLVIEPDNDELPSQRQMYNMIIELTLKYNKLEQKMEKMNKFVDKKIKKINIIDWLNSNKKPDYNFDNLINKINLTQDDINIIFDNNPIDTISILLSRELFDNEIKNDAPIYATIQKNNYIYIYNDIDNNININRVWGELTKDKLIKFMNKFQNKIIKVLADWKQINKNQIINSDQLSEQYNRSLMKIMAIDFKIDLTYNKIKSLFYNKLKVDMKAIIEYEFDL